MFGCTNVRPAGQNGVQPLPPKMCDAARVALCTSNSARAENKPKYVRTELKTGACNQNIMF